MNLVEILTEARGLIADKTNWTQRAFARNADGKSLPLGWDDGAICWCALGAVEKATRGTWNSIGEEAAELLDEVAGDLFGVCDVTSVNDDDGHEHVLKVYDEAIKRAKAEA